MAPCVTRAASRRAEEVYTISRQTRQRGRQKPATKSGSARPVVHRTVEAQNDEDESEDDADKPDEEEEDGMSHAEHSSDDDGSEREGSEPVANLIVNINRNLWHGVPYQERAQRSGSSGRSSRRRRDRALRDSKRYSRSPSVKRKRTLEDSPAGRKSSRLRQTQRNTGQPGRPRKRARVPQRDLGAASPSLSVRREPQAPKAPSPIAPVPQNDDSEDLFLPGDDGPAEENPESDDYNDQAQHEAPVASAALSGRTTMEGDAQMQAFRRSTYQMRLFSQQQAEEPRSSFPTQRPDEVVIDDDSPDPFGSDYEDRVRERALRQVERPARAQSQRQDVDAVEEEDEPTPAERTARIRRLEARDRQIEAERAAKINAQREDGLRRLELFFASTRRMRQAM